MLFVGIASLHITSLGGLMDKSLGQCRCGQTKVILQLPEKLTKYSPRQCDCDFCMARKLLYLSHPDGQLIIESVNALTSEQQGSQQASFYLVRIAIW